MGIPPARRHMRTINDRVHHTSAMLTLHYERLSGEDGRDQAVDTISDILHLCDARGWDVAPILATAHMHHHAEVEEEALAKARRRHH